MGAPITDNIVLLFAGLSKLFTKIFSQTPCLVQGVYLLSNLSKILLSNTPNMMRDQTQVLVGDPAYIIEKINYIQDILQLDYLLLQIDTGSQPMNTSQRTLDLFIEKVMPKL